MRRTVETSPFYAGWLEQTPKDLQEIKQAIAEKDFEKKWEALQKQTVCGCMRQH